MKCLVKNKSEKSIKKGRYQGRKEGKNEKKKRGKIRPQESRKEGITKEQMMT